MAFASTDWRRPKKLEDYLDFRLPLIMIAKLASPLSSPTLAAAQLRNRLPTQLRRLLPLYIACVIFVLIVINLNIFHTGKQQIVLVRPPLGGGSLGIQGATPLVKRREFPHKIWQTWKVGPLVFEERDMNNARSWTEQNPEWRYEVITDGNEMPYVEYHFGEEGFNRTDIVEFYRSVEAKIIKADLLRYLIMYAEGGIYADIDVEALKPMHKFIPERYDVKDIDMVVGVEIDEPDWKDHPILGPKSMSFCQWTFMCKPQLPVMMHLIEHIMTWLNGVADGQNRTISDVELDFDEVISGTGPSAFTNAILKEMNNNKKKSSDPQIDWDTFHDIPESKLISNVLVLTVEAFAAGQGHSNSGNHEARAALVRHHYHASNWPSRHPRYKHPAYAEVEQCNWNDDCIHKWDEDVAAFEKLSEDEQKRIIDEKTREREEEERKRKEEEEENRRREEEERNREEEKRRKEEEAKRQKEEEEKRAKSNAENKEKENKENKDEKPPAEQPTTTVKAAEETATTTPTP